MTKSIQFCLPCELSLSSFSKGNRQGVLFLESAVAIELRQVAAFCFEMFPFSRASLMSVFDGGHIKEA